MSVFFPECSRVRVSVECLKESGTRSFTWDHFLPIPLASLPAVFLPTFLFLLVLLGYTLAVHQPARLCFRLSDLLRCKAWMLLLSPGLSLGLETALRPCSGQPPCFLEILPGICIFCEHRHPAALELFEHIFRKASLGEYLPRSSVLRT